LTLVFAQRPFRKGFCRMFCPQCRANWPSGGGDGLVRVDKPESNRPESSRWGRPLVCPNCQIPLAADRIQGEFPSVAHASSTKEGSMTINDVLREATNANFTIGEVALDDVKPEPKRRLFGIDVSPSNKLIKVLDAVRTQPKFFLTKVAVLCIGFCVCSILFLSVHSIRIPRHQVVSSISPNHSAGAATYTSAQQDLLRLMPAQVGGWTRCESVSQLWNDQSIGNNAVQTFVSTYRLGTERAELWAVKVPTMEHESVLQNFEGGSRAVHTDDGVVNVTPVSFVRLRKSYLLFDYSPAHPKDQYWIHTNQSFVPTKSHTLSWAESNYIVSVAADTPEERDDFVNASGSVGHK
jgi:hypothetical protein